MTSEYAILDARLRSEMQLRAEAIEENTIHTFLNLSKLAATDCAVEERLGFCSFLIAPLSIIREVPSSGLDTHRPMCFDLNKPAWSGFSGGCKSLDLLGGVYLSAKCEAELSSGPTSGGRPIDALKLSVFVR